MASNRKGVTPEQLRDLCKELNLTVAAVAEGTGLSKAYISEFRNETRNLSASQQAQLRSYLEQQCDEAGIDFPDDESPDAAGEQLVKGLGGMIQRISRPAILLADDIPKAQATKLLDLIDANRLKVSELLTGEIEFKSGLFAGGDELTDETDESIRQIFGLLALNYLAILMLQGRSIVQRIGPDAKPKTMGEWLARRLADSPVADFLPPAEKQPKATVAAEGGDE